MHKNLNTYLVVSESAFHNKFKITAAQLGAPANKFLIFVNKDAAQQAEV
jgi:hypothetical protein